LRSCALGHRRGRGARRRLGPDAPPRMVIFLVRAMDV
jgi:hypothetical protein